MTSVKSLFIFNNYIKPIKTKDWVKYFKRKKKIMMTLIQKCKPLKTGSEKCIVMSKETKNKSKRLKKKYKTIILLKTETFKLNQK